MESLISVIVPVYNAEQSIEKCIKALRNQSFDNIEIILVNDGSKDQSFQICNKHSLEDPRIIVINKKNGGVSSARNEGLNIAKSKFVMFCDSDDWPESHWCKDMYAYYQQDNLVMCGCYVEGEQSYLPYEVKTNNGNKWIQRNDYYKLKRAAFNVPWNKIFERRIIEKYQIRFDERLTNGEDYLFVLQYLDKINGDILFIDECLYHYKWPNEQSLSNKVPDNYLGQCCFLSREVLTMASRIGLSNEVGICQIKTDLFNEFQKLIISILHDETLSFIRKIQGVKAIMDTEEYMNCVNDATISSNKLYSLLYRYRSSFGVCFWHSIRKE